MRRFITWFVTNPVATNLLVGFAVVAGVAAFSQITVRAYPDVDLPIVAITVPYLGAAPEEVERGVCTRIEDHVDGVVGIKEVLSTADEGVCTVQVELLQDADRAQALNDIRNQVGAIETFPAEAEAPLVRLVEVPTVVIEIAVTGPTDERRLKQVAREVRTDILGLPSVTQATVANVRPYELAVEVSEESLLRNGLTFDQVAAAVSRNSVDLPGGTIKADQGQVLLRTRGQAYNAEELKNIVVTARPDGSQVLLEDVAGVIDGFEDTSQRFVFDGAPAALVQVSRIGDQDIREIADAVKGYVEEFEASGQGDADGVRLTVWNDQSTMLRDRLGALMGSGIQGLLLVLVVLALFLRPSVALWVAVGIPIALLGAIFLLLLFDMTINLNSIVGFLLVLGMLVDDAVVVGESAYVSQRTGMGQLAGAIDGTERVLVPVTFGVLTTVAAFLPMLYMTGTAGTLLANVGAVVVCCLALSLVECLLVLPAHLAHRSDSLPFGEFGMVFLAILVLGAFVLAPSLRVGIALGIVAVGFLWAAQLWGGLQRLGAAFTRIQVRFEQAFDDFAERRFRRTVRATLERPALAITAGVATVLLAVVVVASGRLPFSILTPTHGDRITAALTMPFGVDEATTAQAMTRLRTAAADVASRLEAEHGEPLVVHIAETYGNNSPGPALRDVSSQAASHLGAVVMQLTPAEERPATTLDIATEWREAVGTIDGIEALAFDADVTAIKSYDIELRLSGSNVADLRAVAADLVSEIEQYPGVLEVGDTYLAGKRELIIDLTPAGHALGLTLTDLGRQVRQAFYGEEAQRVQRGEDDVRIMVRYPEPARRTLKSLQSLRIRTADGAEVPFRTVATVEWGQGPSIITRVAGERTITVQAELDLAQTSADRVRTALQAPLGGILQQYPGISYSFESSQAARESLGSAGPLFLLALFAMFALLAIPLRSYGQPLIILSVLPFCFVGAVAGHLLLGLVPGSVVSLSLPSLMGMVAAVGVAVNATLVLLHSVNHFRNGGDSTIDALENAAVVRCRPILITTVTTLAGLTPLILNTSPSIAGMRPIVVSLAFGVAMAAAAALLFVPALSLVLSRSGSRARTVTTGLANLVGRSPRLQRWMERYPYVQESLASQEFTDLVVEDEGLDAETARIARAGLVRLYYQREFDRSAMDEQLAALAARMPTTDEAVEEVRSWAQQRAFQLAVHMLRSAITPREAAQPLADILDAAVAALFDAARRDTAAEHGDMPSGKVALAALDAAGRRELTFGSPLRFLFLYECDAAPVDATLTPQQWHERLLQRFMRLVGDLSPGGMLFVADAPYRLDRLATTATPDQAAAHAMVDFEEYCAATPTWRDLRTLVHARIILADDDLGDRFDAARQSAITQPRDAESAMRELAAVRATQAGETRGRRGRLERWNVREFPGGLEDMALAAEAIQLASASANPEVVATGLVPTFEAASRHGVVDAEASRDLTDATILWHNLQGFASMVSPDQVDPGNASPEHQQALAEICGAGSFDDLAQMVQAHARRAATHLDDLFRDGSLAVGGRS